MTTAPEVIYADRRARDHALQLGMWIFLGSETLLFAGLFGLYAAYRASFPAAFSAGVAHNDALVGTTNTLVLIVSSFFVAWSIHALRNDRKRMAIVALVLAMLLGTSFLALKTYEYSAHLAEGLAPGVFYTSTAIPHGGARIFFTLYFVMTGLHALHVIGGLAVLGWLVRRIARDRTTARRHGELELGGLYWHLVDIVWIFLWPLLYLTW